jgi:hypothetical protein
MSLRKSRQKCSPTNFFVKIDTQLVPWRKTSTIICTASVIFRPLPKVSENSPNLVTLFWIRFECSLRNCDAQDQNLTPRIKIWHPGSKFDTQNQNLTPRVKLASRVDIWLPGWSWSPQERNWPLVTKLTHRGELFRVDLVHSRVYQINPGGEQRNERSPMSKLVLYVKTGLIGDNFQRSFLLQ